MGRLCANGGSCGAGMHRQNQRLQAVDFMSYWEAAFSGAGAEKFRVRLVGISFALPLSCNSTRRPGTLSADPAWPFRRGLRRLEKMLTANPLAFCGSTGSSGLFWFHVIALVGNERRRSV